MSSFRQSLRWGWACFLRATGALWWARTRLRRRGSIVVIGLHRVMKDTDLRRTNSLPGMIVRRRTFAALTAYAASRFTPVDIGKTSPPVEGKRLALGVTLDDGWSDNYRIAFPIARITGVPIAIFVCPGLVGRRHPFWPERVTAEMKAENPAVGEQEIAAAIEGLKNEPSRLRTRTSAPIVAEVEHAEPDTPDSTMSWSEIVQMSQAGVTFGAHTHTHQLLPTMEPAAARHEIRASKAAIEGALQQRCRVFSYPNGDHSPETRKLVESAGFSCAFTTARGAWTADSDPFAIPRRCVSDDDFVGPAGRFSAAMFEYTVCWTAFRSERAGRQRRARERDAAAGGILNH